MRSGWISLHVSRQDHYEGFPSARQYSDSLLFCSAKVTVSGWSERQETQAGKSIS